MFLFLLELKEKVDGLMKQYEDLKAQTNDRNAALEETLVVSEKFWDDLNTLTNQLKEVDDRMVNQEPPALEPRAIRDQQDYLEALKDDIEASAADIENVHQQGEDLVGLIGEPDKPEVEKNVDDVDMSWEVLNAQWLARSKALEEALSSSTEFHEELMHMLEWLQLMEENYSGLGPIGTDTGAVKQQIEELKVRHFSK